MPGTYRRSGHRRGSRQQKACGRPNLQEPVANASYSRLLQGNNIPLKRTGRCRKAAFEAPDKIDMLVVTGGQGFNRDRQ